MKKRQFSLIELLVVVGIISLLATILVPALIKAKEKTVEMSCSCTLCNIGKMITIFSGFNNDAFPRLIDSGLTYELALSGIIKNELNLLKCSNKESSNKILHLCHFHKHLNPTTEVCYHGLYIKDRGTFPQSLPDQPGPLDWDNFHNGASTFKSHGTDYIYLSWLAEYLEENVTTQKELSWQKNLYKDGFSALNARAGLAIMLDIDSTLASIISNRGGDERTENHHRFGNVLYGDGHVKGFSGGIGASWKAEKAHHGWQAATTNCHFNSINNVFDEFENDWKTKFITLAETNYITGKVNREIYQSASLD